MPLDRDQKAEMVDWVRGIFEASEVVVVMQNTGLSVQESSALRGQAREAGAGIKVVKNRLARLAISGGDGAKIAHLFEGPTMIAFSEDPVTAPKVIAQYAKENEKLVILGGIMGDLPLDMAGVKQLALMPSREEVLSQIAGMLTAPGGNIVAAATAPGAAIASILSTIEEKAGEEKAGA